mgnify:CR=1 FL=1
MQTYLQFLEKKYLTSQKEITVLIIAHRVTTLKECDLIVKLNRDYTFDVGSYQEIIGE